MVTHDRKDRVKAKEKAGNVAGSQDRAPTDRAPGLARVFGISEGNP